MTRTLRLGAAALAVAALTAWAVRGERPTLLQVLGAGLILAGVLLSRRKS